MNPAYWVDEGNITKQKFKKIFVGLTRLTFHFNVAEVLNFEQLQTLFSTL